MYAGGLANRVAHGNVLHHLTLPTLDRGTQDDAAALVIFQERKNVCANEVGEVGAVELKGCYWPRLWCNHCRVKKMGGQARSIFPQKNTD
jgi:hypothetical protein